MPASVSERSAAQRGVARIGLVDRQPVAMVARDSPDAIMVADVLGTIGQASRAEV